MSARKRILMPPRPSGEEQAKERFPSRACPSPQTPTLQITGNHAEDQNSSCARTWEHPYEVA